MADTKCGDNRIKAIEGALALIAIKHAQMVAEEKLSSSKGRTVKMV